MNRSYEVQEGNDTLTQLKLHPVDLQKHTVSKQHGGVELEAKR